MLRPDTMTRFRLDPKSPPSMSGKAWARLDDLTDAEVATAALNDPDNLPLTEAELERMAAVVAVRGARLSSGLSQGQFAAAYRINVARLRDLEQGRTRADSAMLAYLTVITREPEAVARALEGPADQVAERPSLGELRTRLSGRDGVNPNLSLADAVRAERDG